MNARKIISIMVIFTLILSMLSIDRSYAADDGTTIKLSLSPATADRYEYYTNEETLVYLNLDLSGYDATITNADLTITVPAEYLSTIIGSQINTATGPVTATTVDGNKTLTYHFAQLTGGTSIQIPIRVQTLAGDTPNNYMLPVSAVLTSSTDEVMATAETLELKQIVRKPKIVKYRNIGGGGNTAADGSISYGGKGTVADNNIIEPGTEVNQLFNFGVAFDPVVGTTSQNYLGVRRYERIVITDTLPAGAVFSAVANPGWTYDPVSNLASYSIMNPSLSQGSTSYLQFSIPPLKLTFPNGDTRLTYTNTAQVEFFPQNKQDYEGSNVVSTDDIRFKMTTNLPTGINATKISSSFVDQIAQKSAVQSWTCYYANPSDSFNMENLVMEDYNLDTRMDYVSVQLGGQNGVFAGSVNIDGVDATGNVTSIAKGLPYNVSTAYTIPTGTVKILITSTEGSSLLPLRTFQFTVKTKLKDPENVHYNATAPTNNRFNNSLKVSGEYVGTDATATGGTTGSIYITEYKPTVYLIKTSSASTLFIGEETTFTLMARSTSTMLDPDTIQQSCLIDLLPQGLEYVAGSTSMSAADSNMLISKEPTITKNYKGTGRTALTWEFAKPIPPSYSYMNLSYKAKATKEMTQGMNTNEAYWIWENNGSGSAGTQQVLVFAPSYGKADSMDFDNDGNKLETVAYASAPVTYVPPREVLASKYTRGSLDLADTLDGGRTEIGDAFSYTLKVWNNSITDVNQLTALEVLPYLGDKTIVSNAAGNYLNRNSEFPVLLTGPVVGPIGYAVYYTTDLPDSTSAASPAKYGNNANWVTAPLVSDWSSIRGVKIVMDPGIILANGANVKFYLPVKSPADMSLTDGEAARNSFAISVNGGKDFLEANSVGITLVTYKVSGTIFNDANKNGLLDVGEKVFANQEVKLYNEDGTPALDLDGNPIKTTTKADGTYQFTVYDHGNYYVQMAKPQYFETTTQGADDNNLASHISTTTGNTKVFTLTPEINSVVRNGGYYSVTGDLHLEKKVLDADGNTKADGDGSFAFDITLNGKAYVGDVEIDGQTIKVTDGKVSFKSGQEVWIRNIAEGTSYQIKEADTGDYTLSPADGTYTGEVKAKDQIALSFENTEKALGQLSINKIFLDPDGNKIDATRNFTILVTGPSYPDGQEMTLSNDKPLTLTGLKYGTYEVKELNASLYDVTVSGTATLDIKTKQSEITVTNKQKQVRVTTIDVAKTVKGDPKTDETFAFELIPNDAKFPMPAGSDGKQNVTVIGSGITTFGTWAYTEPGVYTYQVKEVAGGNDHYTYDDTVYTIIDTVTMNDNGDLEANRMVETEEGVINSDVISFTNQFKSNEEFPSIDKPETPNEDNPVNTGDSSQPNAWMILVALSLCALAALSLLNYYIRRKANMKQ